MELAIADRPPDQTARPDLLETLVRMKKMSQWETASLEAGKGGGTRTRRRAMVAVRRRKEAVTPPPARTPTAGKEWSRYP